MKVFVVDDDGERGGDLLQAAARKADVEATWLRPISKKMTPQTMQNHFLQVDDFISFVERESATPAAWLWDIQLLFDDGRLEHDDYVAPDGKAFLLLKRILEHGGAVSIISTAFGTGQIAHWLEASGCRANAIRARTESYEAFRDDARKQQFCDVVVRDVLDFFSGSIRELWSKPGWDQHYVINGSGLPHDFELCRWNQFELVFMDILREGHPSVPDALKKELRKSFEGYFEATKTLVGGHSVCHTGAGYSPCLSVLSVLYLRAACMSGVWSEDALIWLAAKMAPQGSMKSIALCSSDFQGRAHTQDWLAILADEVFPILVRKHRSTTAPAELLAVQCDQKGRYFELVFSGSWSALSSSFHDISGINEGGLSSALRRLNVALGDCGDSIGRRQNCTLNAWVEEDKTHIRFAVTS